MRVELSTRVGKIGTIRLVNGRAEGSNARTRQLMERTTIIEPGTLELLTPADGERYLRAAPATLDGSYFFATLVE